MTENYERLIKLLKELFQIDRPDLDFGIYRIMNQKRGEITAFLDKDLLPQVKKSFASYGSGGRGDIQAELDKMVANLKDAGIDPDSSPKVKELKDKLNAAVDVTELENEVYSHLYNFFRRYYKDGDFLSLRRYKKDVYAIPYEGEEVKLHWANADQYYIKSSENFRDYTFKLGELPAEGEEDKRKTVHFKLIEADTEIATKKVQQDKERRFILCSESPMIEEDGELFIHFEYKSLAKKQTQKKLNETAVQELLNNLQYVRWIRELAREENGTPILEKHLNAYTATNLFDYFIHKDLGGFFRRELDFFIKNEVMHLDDIEEENAPRVEQYLSQIKVLRQIAHKLIRFLEQFENYQKKLWLKKKFVVATDYCITLDRIPEDLYPEICANAAQRKEWVNLYAINEIKKSLTAEGYSVPLTEAFLKNNPYLLLDTKHFDDHFKRNLLQAQDVIDGGLDGVLIRSDNFQALNTIENRYKNFFNCIYIDPPYNTSEDSFVYKNNYKHSSWISMMYDRLYQGSKLGQEGSAFCVAIDDTESSELKVIMKQILGQENYVSTLACQVNPAGQNLKPNAPALSHDYCHIFAKDISKLNMRLRGLTEEEIQTYKEEDAQGKYLWDNLRRRGGNSRPADRPKQWFPLYVNLEEKKVCTFKFEGSTEVWPIDPQGEKRIWRVNIDGANRFIESGDISVVEKAGRAEIVKKTRMPEGKKPKTLWCEKRHSATSHGSKLIKDILGTPAFSYPKSLYLVEDTLNYWLDDDGVVLDYFAGSGTTAHAVINMNREDNGNRRYVLVEMGDHFDVALKPRIQRIIYSKSWKNGKPMTRNGSSHMLKYISLESYEDTLNNLEFKKTEAQGGLLTGSRALKEEYTLSYMMDLETEGSASLLNVNRFDDPWNYTMKIATGSAGETRTRPVDLVETFNYLIGLTVIRRDFLKGIEVIEGTNPEGENVLVIWRNTKETNNKQLDEFFHKQDYNTRDTEFALIYVNGDNNLENLKRPDETWKVRLIEEDFKRLMFEVEDV